MNNDNKVKNKDQVDHSRIQYLRNFDIIFKFVNTEKMKTKLDVIIDMNNLSFLYEPISYNKYRSILEEEAIKILIDLARNQSFTNIPIQFEKTIKHIIKDLLRYLKSESTIIVKILNPVDTKELQKSKYDKYIRYCINKTNDFVYTTSKIHHYNFTDFINNPRLFKESLEEYLNKSNASIYDQIKAELEEEFLSGSLIDKKREESHIAFVLKDRKPEYNQKLYNENIYPGKKDYRPIRYYEQPLNRYVEFRKVTEVTAKDEVDERDLNIEDIPKKQRMALLDNFYKSKFTSGYDGKFNPINESELNRNIMLEDKGYRRKFSNASKMTNYSEKENEAQRYQIMEENFDLDNFKNEYKDPYYFAFKDINKAYNFMRIAKDYKLRKYRTEDPTKKYDKLEDRKLKNHPFFAHKLCMTFDGAKKWQGLVNSETIKNTKNEEMKTEMMSYLQKEIERKKAQREEQRYLPKVRTAPNQINHSRPNTSNTINTSKRKK